MLLRLAPFWLVLLTMLAGPPAQATAKDSLIVSDDVTDPLTLDPQKQFAEKNYNILQQVFEGLVRFGPQGDIQPALAESWQRLDDKTVQFKLRHGVVFQDGEQFNAASVKFTIERYLNPSTGFPAIGYLASLDRVDVIDDYTVNVVTRFPDGLLMNRLAALILLVPPKYYSEQPADVLKEKPSGSGPFRFKSWKKGESIELEANPQYWEPGFPKVARLVFRFLKPEDQIRLLLEGKLDLVTDVAGTQTLRIQESKETRIIKSPVLYTIAASFNLSTGPLSDVRVRKALNYAINKDDLVRYDLMGNGLPIHSLVLQGHPQDDEPAGLESYAFDLVKAKALLKESGFKGKLKLRIIDIKAARAAKIIAAAWKRLGIDSEIYSTTDAHMIEDMQKKPTWDMMIGSCPDPMYHPYFIPFIFLYSKSPFSLTKSEAVDSLFDSVVQATDPDKQRKEVMALDEAINREALTLFTYQRIRTYGLSKDLEFEPYLSGMPYFRATHFK